jgi:hypothetical protein
VTFLSQVAEHEQTRAALISLLVQALKSPAVLQEALNLTLWVLDDAKAREHLVSALIAALNNERFMSAAADFAVRWISDDAVKSTVGSVIKEASLQVLEDASVHAEAEKFVKQLLLEPQLQAKTSEHMWAAIKGLIVGPRAKGGKGQSQAVARTDGSSGAKTANPAGDPAGDAAAQAQAPQPQQQPRAEQAPPPQPPPPQQQPPRAEQPPPQQQPQQPQQPPPPQQQQQDVPAQQSQSRPPPRDEDDPPAGVADATSPVAPAEEAPPVAQVSGAQGNAQLLQRSLPGTAPLRRYPPNMA